MKTKMCRGCWSNCRVCQISTSVIVLAFGEGAVPIPDGLDVRFTGVIRERRDLARLLAAADVFVSASLMETYGLTLVEAMACGTPVVAFRVGGIPEAAPDGQGAILCAVQDGTARSKLLPSCAIRRSSARSWGTLAMKRRTLATQRVHLPKHLRNSIESAFRRVKTHSANNQPLRCESASAVWLRDRLSRRGQVHGSGDACEHEALLP